MTHYNISYADLSPEAKRTKAIADIIDWLGQDRYDTISKLFLDMQQAEGKPSWKKFSMALFMSGIAGYPLVAWYETLFGAIEEDGDQ